MGLLKDATGIVVVFRTYVWDSNLKTPPTGWRLGKSVSLRAQ